MRKTVTILFCDVTGSTALGERLDPESLRRVMNRYFDRMKGIIEGHGGTVEKFIGDAVMAVFGVPLVHEDDALRAVRAAVEMRDALATLNTDLERQFAVAIRARIGINTGEVVTTEPGAGRTLVTGDPVNTAARLEQAAPPGEILLGEPTFRLVRDAVKSEAVESIAARGKADPVAAYRVLEVVAGAAALARRLDSPMVGRGRELRILAEAFDRAVSEGGCHLFTVLGSAGVGKSRLIAEFLGTVADEARVLRGRCLPYGDGITFWPVTEIVKQAAGILDEDPSEAALGRLSRLVQGVDHETTIVERVGQAIGLVRDSAVPQETFWAVRTFLEALAAREPLVVVFDDIQWAEPTFLDLVENVADWSRDAPILLLALGRPELLDHRPTWGGGKMNATSILLEPLSEGECEDLVANLLGRARVPGALADRIATAAEGNPLFVEEMVAVLIDDGLLRQVDGGWEAAGDLAQVKVPPTIQALLSARLDRLSSDERVVLGCAAVEGKVFSLAAVADLCPPSLNPVAREHVMALVRKDLLRPHRGDLGGEAFRFRHLLIRDAAYEAVPKAERAELHERFAGWLERTTGERLQEYEEVLGYHLEQAYRYRAELGSVDDRGRALAERAADRLGAAGRRALARGDLQAARTLLDRAVALLPSEDSTWRELSTELGLVLWQLGELARAAEVLGEVIGSAEAAGDVPAAARARVELRHAEIPQSPDRRTMEEVVREIEADIEALEEAGDQRGLSRAWALRSLVSNMLTDFSGMARYAERAIEHARAAGVFDAELIDAFAAGLLFGPVPATEALDRLERAVALVPPGVVVERAYELGRSHLLALVGDEHEARQAAAAGRALGAELGAGIDRAIASWISAHVEQTFGQSDEAERYFREAERMFRDMGERSFLSTLLCERALLLWEGGPNDEVLALANEGREIASLEDVATQVFWRDVTARILARRGEIAEAERLIEEAQETIEATDALTLRAETLRGVSVVHAAAGRTGEAADALRRAIGLLEAKGAPRLAEQIREELAALQSTS
jgi:class 3 adenylate cyclase/tetratricopeptide (TPR) repeat protein